MGIEQFLQYIPYNIESGDPKRPYLLSLFIRAVSFPMNEFGPDSLEFFARNLIPLSTRLSGRCIPLWKNGRLREAKLLETLAMQVWDILPGICNRLPPDVGTGGFALIAKILGPVLESGKPPSLSFVAKVLGRKYQGEEGEGMSIESYLDLRPVVSLSLTHLVQGYVQLSERDQGLSEAGISVLKGFTNRFLASLCNKFTTPDPEVIRNLVTQIGAQQQAKQGSVVLTQPALVASAKNQVLQTIHDRENQVGELAIKAFLKVADEEV